MSLYECVFITRQDIAAPQVDAISDEMAAVVTGLGGQVSKKEYWGLRNIAYRIKKNRKGHYVLFNIDAPSDAVKEMERQMSLNEDVLRYLTVRVEELEETPSCVMVSKNQRDERPRREGGREGGRDSGPRGPRSEGGEA